MRFPLIKTWTLLTLTTALAFVVACGEENAAPEAVVAEDEAGHFSKAEGFAFTRTHEGRVEWEIKAKEAVYSDDEKTARFTDVEALFYPKDSGTLRLSGKRGVFDVANQNIELTDGVRLISSRGYTMTTGHLRYSQADRTIRTESTVFVNGDGMALSCEGMTVDVAGERLIFENNVKSTLWNTDVLAERPHE